MKTRLWLLGLLCLLFKLNLSYAQGPEESIWMSSRFGGSNYGLQFNGSAPATFYNGLAVPAGIVASNAVCDASGSPLFFTSGVSKKVYDRNGSQMPNGDNLVYPSQGSTYSMPPLIVPQPGHPNNYYLFHTFNGALYYSKVNMAMNGGLGSVVEKNVNLTNFAGNHGIVQSGKMVAVTGCDATWVVVRSRNANEYRAYKVADAGVGTTATVSAIGLLPLDWYKGDVYSGRLKASTDGQKLATTCSKIYMPSGAAYYPNDTTYTPRGKGGIELYDFEKCSGRLSQPVVIDSSHNFDGLCFSPDNSKLYATSGLNVYQYDLSLSSTAAITASKTLILVNPFVSVYSDLCGYCCDTLRSEVGDLKRGPDGKLYLGNNRPTSHNACLGAEVNAYHCINNPNLAGLACTPQLNAVSFPTGLYWTGMDMQADLALPPAVPDSFFTSHAVQACFVDTLLLSPDTSALCITWDNGQVGRHLAVHEPGAYIARYFTKDCRYVTDTLNVVFAALPIVDTNSYSCMEIGTGKVKARNRSGDVTDKQFTWKASDGSIIRTVYGQQSDTIVGLLPGNYTLQISTTYGCDTFVPFTVKPIPTPVAVVDVDTLVCAGEQVQFHNVAPQLFNKWDFGDGYSSQEAAPAHSYKQGGYYAAVLKVTNMEGCSGYDTSLIHVQELLLQLLPSTTTALRGEAVTLSSRAPEPYIVLGWTPARFFADQQAYTQSLHIFKTDTFWVQGQSSITGCTSSAMAFIQVEPYVSMPNAFSPNGDGLNDYFRPVIVGEDYLINYLQIFNRWGQLVWSGYGSQAEQGWDGSYKGHPADAGTYFYTIGVTLKMGKQVSAKGDVSLVR